MQDQSGLWREMPASHATAPLCPTNSATCVGLLIIRLVLYGLAWP